MKPTVISADVLFEEFRTKLRWEWVAGLSASERHFDEVAVRAASGLGAEWIGVKLMREAFKRDDGLLTDMSAEPGERVARMELFAGAIGSYKNPHSHRDVAVDDHQEAIEIVLLANHLLRIVDARAAERAAR